METTEIKVGGMSCQGCVKNVSEVLRALPGVASAEVTLEPGRATVGFDAAVTTREALLAAVENAGFDAE